MKRLIIIGNGFDKAHGLKTTFDDFVNSSPIYAEKYSIFRNAENEWCNVEERFKDIIIEKLEEIGSEIDIDEIVEEIIDAYGIDEYGEVSYYGYRSEAFKEEIEAISKIVLLLIDFETNFLNYLYTLYIQDDFRTSFSGKIGVSTHIHRLISSYLNTIVELGFQVVGLEEPTPISETPQDYVYDYPRFLLIKCKKS